MQKYLECSGCRSTCNLLTSSAGTLTDGSESYAYPRDASCQWIISPSSTTQIALTVTDLNTEACCDFLQIFKCTTILCQNPRLIGQMSGSYAFAKTTILVTGYMLVQFASDGGINGDGFTATWQSNALIPSPVSALSTVSCFPHVHARIAHNTFRWALQCWSANMYMHAKVSCEKLAPLFPCLPAYLHLASVSSAHFHHAYMPTCRHTDECLTMPEDTALHWMWFFMCSIQKCNWDLF